MTDQIKPELNVNGRHYIYMDAESGAIGHPGKLTFVEIAEGDMEYLATASPEQAKQYGWLHGEPVISKYEVAHWLMGVDPTLRDEFLALYDPQVDEV